MKKISKVLLLVIVSVAFCFGITGQQVEARDTSIIYGDGTITRAEWLHDLTVMVKGAAGQAVQNMNLMFGLPESEGLELVPMFP